VLQACDFLAELLEQVGICDVDFEVVLEKSEIFKTLIFSWGSGGT
jgi:hypothetical protein